MLLYSIFIEKLMYKLMNMTKMHQSRDAFVCQKYVFFTNKKTGPAF